MSLVLTGRNKARLDETAHQIRRAAPGVKIETVAADLSSRSGVSALLDHVGDRPVEVLVNNAGFGSYGPFAEADPDRETEELAVDVGTVVALARAFLPGMLARGSGGILNVASTIAFQPAPYQAVYGANKAFVLSFSQALWAEARPAGVAVTALCPAPPVQGSSTRWAPMSAVRRSTASWLTSGPSSRPGWARWTRAGPWSSPACGTR
jgi:short-subunit dehydrogenase